MSIEAMKMALEALEERYVGALREKAIDSLRAAIKQVEKQEPVAYQWKGELFNPGEIEGLGVTDAVPLYSTSLAIHPKPVAWMYDFIDPDHRDEIVRDWTTKDYAEIERDEGFNVQPLYLAPRQWVGLTAAELQAIDDSFRLRNTVGLTDYYKAIEQALKEKNCG